MPVLIGCAFRHIVLEGTGSNPESKHKQPMLELIRTSTDGGKISRGTPGGKEKLTGMKHIVWISSIPPMSNTVSYHW